MQRLLFFHTWTLIFLWFYLIWRVKDDRVNWACIAIIFVLIHFISLLSAQYISCTRASPKKNTRYRRLFLCLNVAKKLIGDRKYICQPHGNGKRAKISLSWWCPPAIPRIRHLQLKIALHLNRDLSSYLQSSAGDGGPKPFWLYCRCYCCSFAVSIVFVQ